MVHSLCVTKVGGQFSQIYLFACIYYFYKSNRDFPDNWSGRRGFDRFGNRASGAPTKSQASLLAYA